MWRGHGNRGLAAAAVSAAIVVYPSTFYEITMQAKKKEANILNMNNGKLCVCVCAKKTWPERKRLCRKANSLYINNDTTSLPAMQTQLAPSLF